MQPQSLFDPDDLAFRAWLAAYLAAAPVADNDVPAFVDRAVDSWCRVRLGERNPYRNDVLNAAAVAWVRGPLAAWTSAFWQVYGAKGTLDSALDLLGGGPLTGEEAALLACARHFDATPVPRADISVCAASMKAFHVKSIALSLHQDEANWAPTGTYTGGGAKNMAGTAKMPYTVFLSRALTSPRDVLLALLYELENVKRWHLMEGKRLAENAGSSGRATERAVIEFDTFSGNQATLRAAYAAPDQRGLCVALGVPPVLLVAVPQGQPVAVPSHAALPDKAARNALWWFQTESWSTESRRALWTGSDHGGGMASSTKLYTTK